MNKIAFLSEEQIQEMIAQELASDLQQKRTPEQMEAIYWHGNNILVSASAGSGKTFVMVERIIDQIKRGMSIRELFVSTFTVKAASELKERLQKKLADQLHEAEEQELKAHLAQQLGQVSSADIGTMDSFNQKILQEYGYLLGLAPRFQVLADEYEILQLKGQVFDQVFEEFYQSEAKKEFHDLVQIFTKTNAKLTDFKSLVYSLYNFLQSTADPKNWLENQYLAGNQTLDFSTIEEDLLDQLEDRIEALYKLIDYHYREEAAYFPKSNLFPKIETVLNLIDQSPRGRSKDELLQLIKEIDQVGSLRNGATKEELKPIAQPYNDEYKVIKQEIKDLETTLFQFSYQAAYQEAINQKLELLAEFMKAFSDRYLELKKSENAYEFNDIAHLAIQILSDYPQVAQHYKDLYQEVMIDEYQDTNHLQERMLDLISRGNNLFMVGDIKQSIYRFRQADPDIFNQKFLTYQENPSKGRLIILKENFRSQAEVLTTTNRVFEALMDEEVGEIRYDENHLLLAGNPSKQASNPNFKSQFLFYENSPESNIENGHLVMVAKEIMRLQQEEGVKFKDITLLIPNRNRINQIKSVLRNYQIPFVTDGGDSHYLEAVEVLVMLETLRTINNPLQDYSLIALMKSPMFEFTEDQLARLAILKDGQRKNFYPLLDLALTSSDPIISQDLKDKVDYFLTVLKKWRSFAQTHSLYDLIWKIYQDRLYYDYVGASPNGEQRQANLYALAVRADQFEKKGFRGLSRFIATIDRILSDQKDLDSVPDQAPKDAVTIMSIHKSKGLEFDYVFLLDLDADFTKIDSKARFFISRKKGLGIKYLTKIKEKEGDYLLEIESLLYQENKKEANVANLSERMRLLYVAMTRAAEKLYLVGKGDAKTLESAAQAQIANSRLTAQSRLQANSIQQWLLAIDSHFNKDDSLWKFERVTEEDLLDLQAFEAQPLLGDADLKDVRQSDQIKQALKRLKEVEAVNQIYRSAISLPSLRTPSQIKKLYEPLIDQEGMYLEREEEALEFKLPDFSEKEKVSRAEIGSSLHMLMQFLPLKQDLSLKDIKQLMKDLEIEASIQKEIDPQKILDFLESDLGQLLIKHADKVHREAPFAMLAKDPLAQEDYMIRGILDGYILLEDRIILFDYKTNAYKDPQTLVDQYRDQLSLYKEALKRAYKIDKVESYLILLGGQKLETIRVD